MSEYYVNELSKLTKVSVRTLHHYDQICLLKPSVRLSNGYRVYSEADLLKLQQIIALKSFGFELAQIKLLLEQNVNILQHFAAQSHFLREKANTFLEASDALEAIATSYHDHKFIPWEKIIQLIKVYRMTKKLYTSSNAEKQKEYERYLEENHKIESTKQIEEIILQNWRRAHNELDDLHKAFTEAIKLNLEPDSIIIQTLVERYHTVLRRFWISTKEHYVTLLQLYMNDPECQEYFDQYDSRLRTFLAEALQIFSDEYFKDTFIA
jgi:DNA-binding transcriptional MerR regulator